jgi:2-polyprenyl-3-methyl-5-hydroxy-6-metoxy-1,4-benzoquinol methylase
MTETASRLDPYPALQRLVVAQLAAAPKHANFINKRFKSASDANLAFAGKLAETVERLIDGREPRFSADYDWICQLVLKEELHFRRTGRYRLSTFEEALAEVYSDSELMDHYMNGLLMTSLWWSNHTAAMNYFEDVFLGGNKPGCRHLEIGPGHGLLLALAANSGTLASIEAWDVSEQSIVNTRAVLAKIGVTAPITLRVQDLFALDAEAQGHYDSVVLSEVLEHLDRPADALRALFRVMRPSGRLFINMPINSPAPDHLFLLDTPEEVVEFVKASGFEIESFKFEPTTNYTIEQARSHKFTISCLVIARRPSSTEGI